MTLLLAGIREELAYHPFIAPLCAVRVIYQVLLKVIQLDQCVEHDTDERRLQYKACKPSYQTPGHVVLFYVWIVGLCAVQCAPVCEIAVHACSANYCVTGSRESLSAIYNAVVSFLSASLSCCESRCMASYVAFMKALPMLAPT